jgi:hypothetical protein
MEIIGSEVGTLGTVVHNLPAITHHQSSWQYVAQNTKVVTTKSHYKDYHKGGN